MQAHRSPGHTSHNLTFLTVLAALAAFQSQLIIAHSVNGLTGTWRQVAESRCLPMPDVERVFGILANLLKVVVALVALWDWMKKRKDHG